MVRATFLRRYKRFFADMRLDDGRTVVAHCPNSGSMKSLLVQGARTYLTPTPGNKLKYRWDLLQLGDTLVGVNTHIPNKVMYEVLDRHEFKAEFPPYTEIRKEVSLPEFGARLDFSLNSQPTMFAEVKNVTYVDPRTPEVARFPDAVTVRGQKHVRTLLAMVDRGFQAVLIFFVNRTDVQYVGLAADIDPRYADLVCEARKKGVRVLGFGVHLAPDVVRVVRTLSFREKG